MPNRLSTWIESTLDLLPKHPLIRAVALLLAAWAGVSGAVKGYKEVFTAEKPQTPPAVVNVQVPVAQPPVVNVQVAAPPAPSSLSPAAGSDSKPMNSMVRSLDCMVPVGSMNTHDHVENKALMYWSTVGGLIAESCIRQLLSAGANPNAALPNAEMGYGSGPALHSALNQKRWANALILLDAGANPNLPSVYRPQGSVPVFPQGELALDMAIGANAPPEILDAIRKRDGKSGYIPVRKSQ